jgi:hypothetical protein
MSPASRIASCGIGVGIALTLAGCSTPSTNAESSAQTYLAKAVATSVDRGSVHVVDVTTNGGLVTTLTADLSESASTETIKNSSGTGETDLMVTGGAAYVRASPAVLQNILALTPAVAQQSAGAWIKVLKEDGPYSTIAQALTISGEISPYVPTPASAVVGKQRSIKGVQGNVTPVSGAYNSTGQENPIDANVAIFVASGSGLIRGGSTVAKTGKTVERKYAVFTKWGETVTVAAPSPTLTYRDLYNQ